MFKLSDLSGNTLELQILAADIHRAHFDDQIFDLENTGNQFRKIFIRK